MAQSSDIRRIRGERSTARFFTENPGIAWVVLVLTLAWGIFGYSRMPKRKDPVISTPTIAVVCAWPGSAAEDLEQRVTKKIEGKLAENPNIERLESTIRTSVSITLVKLDDDVKDFDRVFGDLKTKLDSIDDLPQNAGKIQFLRNFGDTATLMLTVASPKVSGIELSLLARSVRQSIEAVRATEGGDPTRATLLFGFPQKVPTVGLERVAQSLSAWLSETGVAEDARVFVEQGFCGVDLRTSADDASLRGAVGRFAQERLHRSELHAEFWKPAVIHDAAEVEPSLTAVAESRYTYRELDEHTELLKQALLASPKVGKVTRSGVLPEAIYLNYEQERFSSHGISINAIRSALAGRNIELPGGIVETQGRAVALAPSGELTSEEELNEVMVEGAQGGKPVYLRDLFQVTRGYQSPPRFLHTLTRRDARNQWQRGRATTLAVHMREGEQIAEFASEVEQVLDSSKAVLPSDLVVARTSDQPRQVEESLSLFSRSLWEAIVLVVMVAFVGYWHWRSALLIALSIPITLAMTLGMMHALGIDLQQMSVASLILALGLLVDDPVVASDAIAREVSAGHPPRIAAWLGPSKLANAIVFATITNVVAYFPLLFVVDGSVGQFIHSLPIVITCSLVASRIVSMTFVPLLGRYLLKETVARRAPRKSQFLVDGYRRSVEWTLEHRKTVLVVALAVLSAGVPILRNLKPSFFPKDLSYYFYVDVWTAEDAALSSTAESAARAEDIIQRAAEDYGMKHGDPNGKPRDIVKSIATFVGGSGPRFWFSVVPELQQLNYAQVVVETNNKYDTRGFAAALQGALSRELVGATADVRELETGKPVGIPVSVRLSGPELGPLRELAERAKTVLRTIPEALRVRDDWGAHALTIPLRIDSDRANLSGVSNSDVALSMVAANTGRSMTTLREGEREIPVLLRQRPEEREGLEGLRNLNVYSSQAGNHVPLGQVASLGLEMRPEKIRRRNHRRTITVGAFPAAGVLASEVLAKARPALSVLATQLPPGYRMEIGGEKEAQSKGFVQVGTALLASVVLIYLALVFEFRSAVKPLVVFSSIPFGVVGALASLWAVGAPFGFMAFLGIASLIGVIVSHVIVLFDFIEEARERGVPLREALLDAGVVRLRPVVVTVGATVLGLIPLASHGGPLWEPLCFAQIGGLLVATVTTLVLVPVIYTVLVLDLRLVRWRTASE